VKIFADDYTFLLSDFTISMEIQGFFEEIDYDELQFLEVCFIQYFPHLRVFLVYIIRNNNAL